MSNHPVFTNCSKILCMLSAWSSLPWHIFFKPYQIIRNSGVRVCTHFDKFRFFILIWEFIQGHHASTLKANYQTTAHYKWFLVSCCEARFSETFHFIVFYLWWTKSFFFFSKYLLFFYLSVAIYTCHENRWHTADLTLNTNEYLKKKLFSD